MSSTPRFAVIDLGTNTFHVLIVEVHSDGSYSRLHKERIFVQLASDGIQTIGEAPYARGIQALKKFKGIMDKLGVEKIKAFGTAALRTASNGKDFILEAKESIGIQIELISGDEEARLIHKGTELALGGIHRNLLIMDIGGGSVEFIIADGKGIHWRQSFKVGVAVLKKMFHHKDPVSREELNAIDTFLKDTLAPLAKALKNHPAEVIVGASGTFDVLEASLPHQRINQNAAILEEGVFYPFYGKIIPTTLAERFAMKEIPDTRAELMIVALQLIHSVLSITGIKEIWVSAFAMKEGILQEMVEEIQEI